MIWLEDDVLKEPLDFEVNVDEMADHSTTLVAKLKSKVTGGWKRINMTPAFFKYLDPVQAGGQNPEASWCCKTWSKGRSGISSWTQPTPPRLRPAMPQGPAPSSNRNTGCGKSTPHG